jgi:serine/threonine protein phosphatase PrpC
MSLTCFAAGQSDVGRLRQANEDRYVIEGMPGESTLLLVCDGMGGHEGGQIASQVAVSTIVEGMKVRASLPPPQALFESLKLAHDAVRREALARSLTGMGTTAVAAWVVDNRAWVGWVGDSRFYQLREGRVLEKTTDHTKVQRLISEGRLAPSEAVTHPEAHVLERALGGVGEAEPEVWNEPVEVQKGDVLLMCTDGLHDMINDALLFRLMEGKPPPEAVHQLIERANMNGGHDNVTAVVACFGEERVPMLPELEDTESGDRRVSSSSSGNKSAQRSIVPQTRVAIPSWAIAVVAAGALLLGLAMGVRWGQAHPAGMAAAAPP